MSDSRRKWGDWYFEPDRLELFLDRAGCVEYTVDLEMCRTSGQILNLLTEIAGKDWIEANDVFGLLQALNDLLQLQENLCPGGAEKHLDRDDLVQIVQHTEAKSLESHL